MRHLMRFVISIPLSLLPSRLWERYGSFPLSKGAAISAVLTMIAGACVWAFGYLDHLATHATNPTRIAAIFIFLTFTPTGWLVIYLLGTGIVRLGAAWIGDPTGDLTLGLLDEAIQFARQRSAARRLAHSRFRLEGPETRDFVIAPHTARMTDCDVVIVASRRKVGWETGTAVVTQRGTFRVGDPVERMILGRLRTLYPLRRDNSLEVIRKSVNYTMPDGG